MGFAQHDSLGETDMKTAVKRSFKVQETENLEEEITVQEKFKLARSAMCSALVERDAEIDLVLTALIANENPLLVGPPGSGKSLLLDNLASWVETEPFDYLLTKFTDPMELFGPVDLKALKESKYKRIVDGYLPTATFAFLDEIWKGSSAILNTLLNLLNEKKFRFGNQRFKCPLVICVSASNEWPNSEETKELGAIFDRYLFRKPVEYVSLAGKRKILDKAVANDLCQASFPCKITPEEIRGANQASRQLPFSDDANRALWDIVAELHNNQGIRPSDRRIGKSIGAARANAYLNGGKEVLPEHLEVLAHVLWDDPEEQPIKCEKVVARIANPLGARVLDLQRQAQDVEDQAEKQLKDLSSAHDREGVCRGVLSKLGEIQQELKILKQNVRRDQVLDYVTDAVKTWNCKLIGVNRK